MAIIARDEGIYDSQSVVGTPTKKEIYFPIRQAVRESIVYLKSLREYQRTYQLKLVVRHLYLIDSIAGCLTTEEIVHMMKLREEQL